MTELYKLNTLDILNCYESWPKIKKATWVLY